MRKKYYTTFIITAAAVAMLAPLPTTMNSYHAKAKELTTSQTGPVSTPIAADTFRYRGIVTDLFIPESATEDLQFTLIQPKGMNLGADKITFKASHTTKFNFEKEDLKEGAYMEVYYNPQKAGVLQTETAISINKVADTNSTVFNGKVIKLTPDVARTNSGDILIKDYASGQEFIFHYGEDTKFSMDPNDIEEGVSLNIHYSGALTRSIPAQGTAMEISRYASTSTYRGTLSDITTQNGVTTLTLQRPEGSGSLYAKDTLKIKLNKNSRLSIPASDLKKGTFIEVFYNNSRKVPTASSLFAYSEGLSPNFNGIITSINADTEKANTGSITVTDFNGTNETIYHYYNETKFQKHVEELKVGDKIHIFHKGIMTMSLPPQCNALEIAPYVK